jgi:hypothetical protein
MSPRDIPTNLDVSVTVDPNGIVSAEPDTLLVPHGFDGTITWMIQGATFLTPALTFAGEAPPSFELSTFNTPTMRIRRWGNFIEGRDPLSYYYTVHVALNDRRIEHDPTIENEPPQPTP